VQIKDLWICLSGTRFQEVLFKWLPKVLKPKTYFKGIDYLAPLEAVQARDFCLSCIGKVVLAGGELGAVGTDLLLSLFIWSNRDSSIFSAKLEKTKSHYSANVDDDDDDDDDDEIVTLKAPDIKRFLNRSTFHDKLRLNILTLCVPCRYLINSA
jgi:hypothetical protein